MTNILTLRTEKPLEIIQNIKITDTSILIEIKSNQIFGLSGYGQSIATLESIKLALIEKYNEIICGGDK